jgi:hypothetical protein
VREPENSLYRKYSQNSLSLRLEFRISSTIKFTFFSLAYTVLALLIASSDKSEPVTLKPRLVSHIACVAGPVKRPKNLPLIIFLR